nr:hypothetical protein [Tanacetum cinerariifolium]
PYAEDASPIAQSPEYVPESDFEAHPDDDYDEDREEDPVDYLVDGGDDDDDEEDPICSLGYRAAMIRLRDKTASTLSPPLQLPSTSRREDRPEVTLPPQKRLCIALGPRYEVGESSSAAAARPAGETLQGAPVSTDTELGGYVREFKTRAHAYKRHLMETEDRMSREAWVRATDLSDLVHGEVMSLRTTVLGQMSEIRELHPADRRRQTVISELLRIDHRRPTEILELRIALQG